MMNKEIKEKWVAALRSGDYQQGKEVLRTGQDKFCCLGVLCDLHRQEHPGYEWIFNPNREAYVYHDKLTITPNLVVNWAGLSAPNPPVSSQGEARNCLATCNDKGMTFNEIADIIEKEL